VATGIGQAIALAPAVAGARAAVTTITRPAWKDITPLARNEFICWVEDARQELT
jgi:hypothetical protein